MLSDKTKNLKHNFLKAFILSNISSQKAGDLSQHSFCHSCPIIAASHKKHYLHPSDFKVSNNCPPLRQSNTQKSFNFSALPEEICCRRKTHEELCRHQAGAESPFSNIVSSFLTYHGVLRDSRVPELQNSAHSQILLQSVRHR